MTPKRPLIPFLSIALFALPTFSTIVYAQEFLCDATQASSQELPQLDQACPIGKGLWGKPKPNSSQSQFWIQCGVYSKPLPLRKAKSLYQHISTDVWLKPEGKNYRCLIGPYEDFTLVSAELKQVKQEPSYREAFIREIVTNSAVKQTKGVTKSPTQPANKLVAVEQQVTTMLPAVTATKVEPKRGSSKRAQASNKSVRLSTSINGVEYQVAYNMFGDEQFYMEHNLPWNRMNYDNAYKTCYRQGMRLANQTEWQALLDSGVMTKDNWPTQLPYWGLQKTGLFYSGKVNHLKGTSLLNVMCVK